MRRATVTIVLGVLALAGCGGSGETTDAAGPSPAAKRRAAAMRAQNALDTAPKSSSGRVLDPYQPFGLATDGRRLVWLRDLGRGGRALVERDPRRGRERVVVPRLPFRVTHVTVGTTATGAPYALLERDGRGDPATTDTTRAPAPDGALYGVPLTGAPAIRRLPVSDDAGTEAAPSLRRGTLVFARRERFGGETVVRVRMGTLTGRASRVLWRGPANSPVVATAVGTDDRVAFTTHLTEGDVAVWTLRTVAPDVAEHLVATTGSGLNSRVGLGPLTVDATGRRVSVFHWGAGDTARSRMTTHDLVTGRTTRTDRVEDLDVAVPLADGSGAGYRADPVTGGCVTPSVRHGGSESVACPLVLKDRLRAPQRPDPVLRDD